MRKIYDELNIDSDNPHISEICEFIKNDSIKIEKAFYFAFDKLRETKNSNTILTYASTARNALAIMGMNKKRLKIPPKKKIETDNISDIKLPLRMRNLSNDNKMVQFINDRFKYATEKLNCKSKHAQTTMLRYWVTILEQFGDLNTLDMDKIDLSMKNVIDIVKPIINSEYYIIYLHHLFFGINDEWNIKVKILHEYIGLNKLKKEENDGDKDTLTPLQQDNIWKACGTTLEKLMIALLLTTGMRVGGMCNIKKIDVYDESANSIRDFGKTLEKRGKTRRFPIFDMVKKPLAEWIEENHMIQSEYLFPNARDTTKPISTLTFQNLFKSVALRAGYTGTEIHIHSARHSVARNLLEAGNSMDEIGKYLGHSNPATTAKYYANLSVKETVDRMNTLCIGGNNNKQTYKPQLPTFGKSVENENKKYDKKKKNKLGKLADVDIGGSSISEDILINKLEKIRSKKIQMEQK